MIRLSSGVPGFCLCAACALPVAARAQNLSNAQPAPAERDWSGVEKVFERIGMFQPDGTYKYAFARSDLHVIAGGVEVRPALALGSWLAFIPDVGGSVMAMGELVLLENEVGPVVAALRTGGMRASAIHNHLLYESPRIMYVHVEGSGDATRIARTVRSALGRSETPMDTPAAGPTSIDLDTDAVARALGYRGIVNGGVYQVSIPRADAIRSVGKVIPPSAGVATGINFQPTGKGKAAITGDFVMLSSEVQKVIDALMAGGIRPTALHNHMIGEEPRLYFMHFWANADAVRLASTLHNALAMMNVKSPG